MKRRYLRRNGRTKRFRRFRVRRGKRSYAIRRRAKRSYRRKYRRGGNLYIRSSLRDRPVHTRFVSRIIYEQADAGQTTVQGTTFTFATIQATSSITDSITPFINMYRFVKVHHRTIVFCPCSTQNDMNNSYTSAGSLATTIPPSLVVVSNHYGTESKLNTWQEMYNQPGAKLINNFIGNRQFAITRPVKTRTVNESTNASGVNYGSYVRAPWIKMDEVTSVIYDDGIRWVVDSGNNDNVRTSFKIIIKYYMSFKGLKIYS